MARVDPRAYLVCYDICDPKRLRRVYKTMRGYGEHVQFSIFLCSLPPIRLASLRADLEEIIAPTEDQVMVVALGSPDAGALERLSTIGKPLAVPEHVARVF